MTTSSLNDPPLGEITRRPHQRAGLVAGLAVFTLLLLLPPPDAMPAAAWKVTAVAVLMAIWWMSEALPISATALLPLVAFPLLGVTPMKSAAVHYAHPAVFLIFGGFVIAAAMEKWNLHRRIALHVLNVAGTRPDALIGGFMIATAFLSMWISNTATCIMMLPIGISVIELVNRNSDGESHGSEAQKGAFAIVLLLSIAYSASIGGLGTLIGTAPNALFAGYMSDTYDRSIGFAKWMLFGVPLASVMLVLSWGVLTRVAYAVGRRPIEGISTLISRELRLMGPMSQGELRTAIVFSAVAIAWMLRPLIEDIFPGVKLSDAGIAVTGALVLFLTPVNIKKGVFLMDRDWSKRIAWNVLILFGGGLSLAASIRDTGLSAFIGQSMEVFITWPVFWMTMALTATVIFLTELTSNTATAIVFLPLTASLAAVMGMDPVMLLIPAITAASCAFMIPVATPPNAIVFSSGKVTIPQMARAGLFINAGAIVIITIAAMTLARWVFG